MFCAIESMLICVVQCVRNLWNTVYCDLTFFYHHQIYIIIVQLTTLPYWLIKHVEQVKRTT